MTKPNAPPLESAKGSSPDTLRRELKRAFETMSNEDLETMRKLQRAIRERVPEGESLASDLIKDRRKEGAA